MMFRTHFLFSVLCALLIVSFLDVGNKLLFGFVFILFGLVPDIDLPKSKVGKRHKIVSNLLNIMFGHRGFIHTIFPALGFFALFYFLGYGLLGFAALLGYVSHLVLDMLTPHGIRIFFPFSDVNVKGFVYTAGFLEYLLQVVIVVGIVYVGKGML